MCGARASLLALLAAVLATSGCGGGDQAHLVADPAALDFGRVIYGEEERSSVVLRNAGSGTVFISSVKANCACFSVGSFLRTLRPGDATDLPVLLISSAGSPEDLRGKRLDIVYSVMLDGGGRTTQNLELLQVPLEGEIVETRRIRPPRVLLDARSPTATDDPPRVRVRPGRGFRLGFLGATLEPSGLCRFTSQEVEDGVDLLLYAEEGTRGSDAVLTIRTEVSGEGFETRRYEDNVMIEVRR
ncbi:MAG: Ig-like domain-containing protein [Planctomycetota bacterium]|jgi:hypothetical protein